MTKEGAPPHRKKTRFACVGNVLNSVVTKLGLDRRLREQALLNLWPIVVGDTFASKTRPLFIDCENNLVVAAQDAAVAQEMSFIKREITNKLKRAGQSTGITIVGVRLDLKHYHRLNQDLDSNNASLSGVKVDNVSVDDGLLERPDDLSLAAVSLSESELDEIEELKAGIEQNLSSYGDSTVAQTSQMSERIARLVEREMRVTKWQKIKGFPSCSQCGLPAGRLHSRAGLCSYCYQKKETGQA
jgi:predicted nucleic acid-binding Zn ribbon protein